MATSDEKIRSLQIDLGENLGELCQEKGLESALLKLAAWEPNVKMNHHQLWLRHGFHEAVAPFVSDRMSLSATSSLWFDVLR